MEIDYTKNPDELFLNGKTSAGNLNLQIPEVREHTKEFEKEIEEATKKTLKHEIEYYGKPIAVIPAFGDRPEIKLKGGYVENEILGTVHPGEVQYCEEREIIVKKKYDFGNSWIITNKGTPLYYDNFLLYKSALSLLKANREKAKKIEREDADNMLRKA